jgi:hypothetical protein
MGDLDGQIRTLIELMMLGAPWILSPGEQQIIAT